MTSDESLNAGTPPEAVAARTLGSWVAALADDARDMAELSQQFPPGAPLRAALRAGLRHLLHIERLSRGIEGLAMLEVAIMLRVTALLASPAEELDSETVLRLRADTPLIEELFPDEKDVIWRFCQTLIETERGLPSEHPVVATALPLAEAGTDGERATDGSGDFVPPPATLGADTETTERASSVADDQRPAEDGSGADSNPLPPEEQVDVASASTIALEPMPEGNQASAAAVASVAAPADELVERLRVWAATYRAPTFGTKPHDLTRASAFVRTRVSAWAGL